MQKAGHILADVLFAVVKEAKPGVSELDLDAMAERMIREHGGEEEGAACSEEQGDDVKMPELKGVQEGQQRQAGREQAKDRVRDHHGAPG